MNNKRRKILAQALSKIEEVSNMIQDVYDEEDECMNNMPENLQGGDQYAQLEANCDQLQECIDLIDEITGILDEVIGG